MDPNTDDANDEPTPRPTDRPPVLSSGRGVGVRPTRALATAAILVLATTAGVLASHNPDRVYHYTYEAAGTGDLEALHGIGGVSDPEVTCALQCVTSDGWIDVAMHVWNFPDVGCDNCYRYGPGETDVPGEYNRAVFHVHDDTFGHAIGAVVCTDWDGDGNCGEASDPRELRVPFCGADSPVIEAPGDSDGDGHDDFGPYVVLILNGPYHQQFPCDWIGVPSNNNPVGATTGGITGSPSHNGITAVFADR